jgi:hypothetical protein
MQAQAIRLDCLAFMNPLAFFYLLAREEATPNIPQRRCSQKHLGPQGPVPGGRASVRGDCRPLNYLQIIRIHRIWHGSPYRRCYIVPWKGTGRRRPRMRYSGTALRLAQSPLTAPFFSSRGRLRPQRCRHNPHDGDCGGGWCWLGWRLSDYENKHALVCHTAASIVLDDGAWGRQLMVQCARIWRQG